MISENYSLYMAKIGSYFNVFFYDIVCSDSDTAPHWLWAGSALVIKCTLNKVTWVIEINFGTLGYMGVAMAKYVIIQDMECTLDKGPITWHIVQ